MLTTDPRLQSRSDPPAARAEGIFSASNPPGKGYGQLIRLPFAVLAGGKKKPE
jgi:hypothetical protein